MLLPRAFWSESEDEPDDVPAPPAPSRLRGRSNVMPDRIEDDESPAPLENDTTPAPKAPDTEPGGPTRDGTLGPGDSADLFEADGDDHPSPGSQSSREGMPDRLVQEVRSDEESSAEERSESVRRRGSQASTQRPDRGASSSSRARTVSEAPSEPSSLLDAGSDPLDAHVQQEFSPVPLRSIDQAPLYGDAPRMLDLAGEQARFNEYATCSEGSGVGDATDVEQEEDVLSNPGTVTSRLERETSLDETFLNLARALLEPGLSGRTFRAHFAECDRVLVREALERNLASLLEDSVGQGLQVRPKIL